VFGEVLNVDNHQPTLFAKAILTFATLGVFSLGELLLPWFHFTLGVLFALEKTLGFRPRSA
jgi:hypothetical protein